MSRNLSRLAICVALAVAPASAAVVVGNCMPLTHFNTISAAISAVPPGTLINICPGTYPEQIVIDKKLTLKGVTSGTNPVKNAVVIAPPPGGVVANSSSLSSGTPVAAQVLVDGVSPSLVSISNIVVDGSNNKISACDPLLIGIYFRNSSGSVIRTSVVNQVLGSGLEGCQSGLGIYVQSNGSNGLDTVTLSTNYVHNFQKNGITANESNTKVIISGNTVIGQGATIGAAENSIQVGFGAQATVSGNNVGGDVWAPDTFGDTGNAAAGILIFASSGVSVTGNTVTDTQYGITVDSDSTEGTADATTITGNKIATTRLYDGIDLCSNGNIVKTNTITGSDEAGIHNDATCGSTGNSNTISGNTIHTACAGILSGPGVSNSIGTNTFINTTNQVLTGTDVCQVAAPTARHFAVRRRPVAFRP